MTVTVNRTEASVAVSVDSVGSVTAVSIDAAVSPRQVAAVVESSGGRRGLTGPPGETGAAGQSVEVHWSNLPPLPGQGNVGDIWVVV